MPRTLRYCALFLCSLFPFAGQVRSASGQATPVQATPVQPAPASPQPGASLPSSPASAAPSAAAPEGQLRLDIVVTDHSGKPIPGLTAADFTVLDNNQAAKVLSFHAFGPTPQQDDPPVQVIVLFDTVNTDFSAVSYTRQQVESYLRRNGGNLPYPTSRAFLTNTSVEFQATPTQDGNALAASLDASEARLRTITSAAGAYGAIERFELSSRLLDSLVRKEAGIPGRKLLIWAGPGWPLLDSPNINMSMKAQQSLFTAIVQFSGLLRAAQVELYSISQGMPDAGTFLYESFLKGVKKSNQAQIPNLALKVLAVQSGGVVLAPTNDVASSVATCVQDAGTYYTVTFEPPPADGPDQYHKLDVRVDKPGLTARTNTGYYDEPAGR
jgi:VWFA-related protein